MFNAADIAVGQLADVCSFWNEAPNEFVRVIVTAPLPGAKGVRIITGHPVLSSCRQEASNRNLLPLSIAGSEAFRKLATMFSLQAIQCFNYALLALIGQFHKYFLPADPFRHHQQACLPAPQGQVYTDIGNERDNTD